MRASAVASHELGGTHISGAERIVSSAQLVSVSAMLTERALSRNLQPAFLQITCDQLTSEPTHVPVIHMTCWNCASTQHSHRIAAETLLRAGVPNYLVQFALAKLQSGLGDTVSPLRGAALWHWQTGERLDTDLSRGVRVSTFDYSENGRQVVQSALHDTGLNHFRTQDALAVATKAVWAGITAEICWSDDDYSTGYVATAGEGYVRLPNFKPDGARGGRIFLVDPSKISLDELISRLEDEAVLIDGPLEINSGTSSL